MVKLDRPFSKLRDRWIGTRRKRRRWWRWWQWKEDNEKMKMITVVRWWWQDDEEKMTIKDEEVKMTIKDDMMTRWYDDKITMITSRWWSWAYMEPLPPLPGKGLVSVTIWRRSQNEKGRWAKKKREEKKGRKKKKLKEKERKGWGERVREKNAVGHKMWGEGVANFNHIRQFW